MNIEALHKYFYGVADKPLTLGHLDCVRFCAEALYVGFDRDYRGELGYWDRRSAVVRLRRAGGLRDAMIQALGEELPASDLITGDVAYFETPSPVIGLVLPTYVAVKSRRAIHRVNFSAMTVGWRT